MPHESPFAAKASLSLSKTATFNRDVSNPSSKGFSGCEVLGPVWKEVVLVSFYRCSVELPSVRQWFGYLAFGSVVTGSLLKERDSFFRVREKPEMSLPSDGK